MPAPFEIRKAISWERAMARTAIRLATFVQAMTSTSPTKMPSTPSARPYSACKFDILSPVFISNFCYRYASRSAYTHSARLDALPSGYENRHEAIPHWFGRNARMDHDEGAKPLVIGPRDSVVFTIMVGTKMSVMVPVSVPVNGFCTTPMIW